MCVCVWWCVCVCVCGGVRVGQCVCEGVLTSRLLSRSGAAQVWGEGGTNVFSRTASMDDG